MTKKKAYSQRSDIQKIHSQWNKLSGLHSREEWSAAIVRAATAAELSANFALRKEFEQHRKLKSDFVDALLTNANGLSNKMNRLLLPLLKAECQKKKQKKTTAHEKKHAIVHKLNKLAQEINTDRNSIVHQGQFRSQIGSMKTIAMAKEFIEGLVRIYEPEFVLKDKNFIDSES